MKAAALVARLERPADRRRNVAGLAADVERFTGLGLTLSQKYCRRGSAVDRQTGIQLQAAGCCAYHHVSQVEGAK
jgi:predicted nucleic acid-binding Zn ribbon protein